MLDTLTSYLPSAPLSALIAGLIMASGAIYLSVVMLFIVGLLVTRRRVNGVGARDIPVAVLIAARDEASVIDDCLESLSLQDYPAESTEIVVIDDRSADSTGEKARQWSDRIPGLTVVPVSEDYYQCPKKNALEHGIRASRGRVILTTDADCRPGPEWISELVSAFGPSVGDADEEEWIARPKGRQTGMVAGYAPLSPANGFLERLLSLQSLVVGGLSAGSAAVNMPLACSGRSLSYLREAFVDTGGFGDIGNIIGGDDVLLMRKFASSGRWRVRFQPGEAAAVASSPHRDRQLGRQIRYQSKAIHYGVEALLLLIPVYIFHLGMIAGPLLALTYVNFPSVFGTAVVAKIIVDALFTATAAWRLGDTRNLALFPAAEVLSIPYVAVVAAFGALRRGASPWK